MVGNLKKTVIFFKFPTVFLRKKKRIKQQNRFSRRRPAGDYPHTV